MLLKNVVVKTNLIKYKRFVDKIVLIISFLFLRFNCEINENHAPAPLSLIDGLLLIFLLFFKVTVVVLCLFFGLFFFAIQGKSKYRLTRCIKDVWISAWFGEIIICMYVARLFYSLLIIPIDDWIEGPEATKAHYIIIYNYFNIKWTIDEKEEGSEY